ncbi:hypothetical protein, partial [Natrarchaeobius oligotrophus]|uniref:hypothetical protein n=1 Tax=Natrarchaeobius oligotrophus TaxID=3455743 RepID=UPI001A9EDFC6
RFGVGSEIKLNFLVNRVDEEVKNLVLVDRTVCLRGIEHTIGKRASFLVAYYLAEGLTTKSASSSCFVKY